MSTYDDVPWWTVGPVDEWPRMPWSGEVVPVEPGVDPGQDFGDWEAELNNVKTNVEFVGKTITTPVKVVVHTAESIWDSVTHLFADPSPDAPTAPAVVGPTQDATIPAPDPPVQITGPGPVAHWGDYWSWATETTHAATPDVPVPQPIAGTQVQHAIDVAMGQTIKALSGPINQNLDVTKFAAAVLSNQITDTQQVIGALANDQNLTNAQLHAALDGIANNVLPTMQDEIARLRADVQATATGVITILQTWATDNIHKPLEEEIATEKANRIAQVDVLAQSIPGIIAQRVAAMGLATGAALATVGAAVDKLTQESTDCTQPMCDTMGPNTNLGKILKALSLASEAAFIAELLAMNESDLVAFLQTVAGKVAGVIDDVETNFLHGGETIGGFIKNTIEGAV